MERSLTSLSLPLRSSGSKLGTKNGPPNESKTRITLSNSPLPGNRREPKSYAEQFRLQTMMREQTFPGFHRKKPLTSSKPNNNHNANAVLKNDKNQIKPLQRGNSTEERNRYCERYRMIKSSQSQSPSQIPRQRQPAKNLKAQKQEHHPPSVDAKLRKGNDVKCSLCEKNAISCSSTKLGGDNCKDDVRNVPTRTLLSSKFDVLPDADAVAVVADSLNSSKIQIDGSSLNLSLVPTRTLLSSKDVFPDAIAELTDNFDSSKIKIHSLTTNFTGSGIDDKPSAGLKECCVVNVNGVHHNGSSLNSSVKQTKDENANIGNPDAENEQREGKETTNTDAVNFSSILEEREISNAAQTSVFIPPPLQPIPVTNTTEVEVDENNNSITLVDQTEASIPTVTVPFVSAVQVDSEQGDEISAKLTIHPQQNQTDSSAKDNSKDSKQNTTKTKPDDKQLKKTRAASASTNEIRSKAKTNVGESQLKKERVALARKTIKARKTTTTRNTNLKVSAEAERKTNTKIEIENNEKQSSELTQIEECTNKEMIVSTHEEKDISISPVQSKEQHQTSNITQNETEKCHTNTVANISSPKASKLPEVLKVTQNERKDPKNKSIKPLLSSPAESNSKAKTSKTALRKNNKSENSGAIKRAPLKERNTFQTKNRLPPLPNVNTGVKSKVKEANATSSNPINDVSPKEQELERKIPSIIEKNVSLAGNTAAESKESKEKKKKSRSRSRSLSTPIHQNQSQRNKGDANQTVLTTAKKNSSLETQKAQIQNPNPIVRKDVDANNIVEKNEPKSKSASRPSKAKRLKLIKKQTESTTQLLPTEMHKVPLEPSASLAEEGLFIIPSNESLPETQCDHVDMSKIILLYRSGNTMAGTLRLNNRSPQVVFYRLSSCTPDRYSIEPKEGKIDPNNCVMIKLNTQNIIEEEEFKNDTLKIETVMTPADASSYAASRRFWMNVPVSRIQTTYTSQMDFFHPNDTFFRKCLYHSNSICKTSAEHDQIKGKGDQKFEISGVYLAGGITGVLKDIKMAQKELNHIQRLEQVNLFLAVLILSVGFWVIVYRLQSIPGLQS